MQITHTATKSILTPQKSGLLATPPYPFTHSLSPYTGCAFGNTTCGLYCYAQFLPNWVHTAGDSQWGSLVRVKENAPELLEAELARMKPEKRRTLRIFMASTTDPYQPIERHEQVTRRCLEVFARYPDLDLLLVQTRSPLAARDFDLMRQLPYVWLSLTIETDDQTLLAQLRGGPPLRKRFETIEEAARLGIHTQIAVSPCLAYTPDFAARLLASGVERFVIDTFVEGDGSRGARTGQSPIATLSPPWRARTPALTHYEELRATGADAGWSASGFCGIPPRQRQPALFN
jgi:DNA repair photolyase